MNVKRFQYKCGNIYVQFTYNLLNKNTKLITNFCIIDDSSFYILYIYEWEPCQRAYKTFQGVINHIADNHDHVYPQRCKWKNCICSALFQNWISLLAYIWTPEREAIPVQVW